MESKLKNEKNREKTPTPISEKLQVVVCRRSESETGARERENVAGGQKLLREPELNRQCQWKIYNIPCKIRIKFTRNQKMKNIKYEDALDNRRNS